jgi:hypothetical protein
MSDPLSLLVVYQKMDQEQEEQGQLVGPTLMVSHHNTNDQNCTELQLSMILLLNL